SISGFAARSGLRDAGTFRVVAKMCNCEWPERSPSGADDVVAIRKPRPPAPRVIAERIRAPARQAPLDEFVAQSVGYFGQCRQTILKPIQSAHYRVVRIHVITQGSRAPIQVGSKMNSFVLAEIEKLDDR